MSSGNKNLISFNKRSVDEVRKIASKGGINSVKVRQAQKTWKAIAQTILNTKLSDSDVEQLKKFGITKEEANYNVSIVYQMVKKAMDGDINAYDRLERLTGNTAPQQVEFVKPNSETINEIDDYLEKGDANGNTKKDN